MNRFGQSLLVQFLLGSVVRVLASRLCMEVIIELYSFTYRDSVGRTGYYWLYIYIYTQPRNS